MTFLKALLTVALVIAVAWLLGQAVGMALGAPVTWSFP